MNKQFKEYTDKGFEFFIGKDEYGDGVDVYVRHYEGEKISFVFGGDDIDHAFAACDLWLEGR